MKNAMDCRFMQWLKEEDETITSESEAGEEELGPIQQKNSSQQNEVNGNLEAESLSSEEDIPISALKQNS